MTSFIQVFLNSDRWENKLLDIKVDTLFPMCVKPVCSVCCSSLTLACYLLQRRQHTETPLLLVGLWWFLRDNDVIGIPSRTWQEVTSCQWQHTWFRNELLPEGLVTFNYLPDIGVKIFKKATKQYILNRGYYYDQTSKETKQEGLNSKITESYDPVPEKKSHEPSVIQNFDNELTVEWFMGSAELRALWSRARSAAQGPCAVVSILALCGQTSSNLALKFRKTLGSD